MENIVINDVCDCLSYLLDLDIICELDKMYKDGPVWRILPRYKNKKDKKTAVLIEIERHKYQSILQICLDVLIYTEIINTWFT
jgi:hypothetical protein